MIVPGKTPASEREERDVAERQRAAILKRFDGAERVEVETFIGMFDAVKKDASAAIGLMEGIYYRMIKMSMSPKVVREFRDNFPFVTFVRLACETTNPDLASLAVQCVAEASESELFPSDEFANEAVLGVFARFTASEDTLMVKAAIRVIGNVVRASATARDWIIVVGIMDRLVGLDASFNNVELVLKMCQVAPPPSPPLVVPVCVYLKRVLDRAEVDVLDLAISAVCALLENGADVSADAFMTDLPHLIASGEPAIVPQALKVLLYVSAPNPEICQIMMNVLQEEDKPAVLIALSKVLSRFHEVCRPICGSLVFETLLSKLGSLPYRAEVACVGAALQYFDVAYANDMRVFRIATKFVRADELARICMSVIMVMLPRAPNDALKAEMLDLMASVTDVLDDICASGDETMVTLAEQCLAALD